MKAALLVTLLLALSAELTAQVPAGPCPDLYREPQVGHYAELRFTNAADESMEIRFAIVGEESIDGRGYYWMEVVSAPPAVGAPVIAQMLIPHYPFEQAEIEGYVVKMPGQPALRMPRQMIAQLGADAAPGPSWRQQCAAAVDLGAERVTVPAGTFSARHFRAGDAEQAEVWMADVPFGMVKLVQPDGRMELLRYGSDASSSIDETPVELDMPPPPGSA